MLSSMKRNLLLKIGTIYFRCTLYVKIPTNYRHYSPYESRKTQTYLCRVRIRGSPIPYPLPD